MSDLRARSRFLPELDAEARIEPDPVLGGAVLRVGGAEQSHVDPQDPRRIVYEYLARIAALSEQLAPAGRPLRALHLGGGAMTLPRYLQASRPGSEQVVVEIARGLPDLVLSALPLPEGSRVRCVADDARAALTGLADGATTGRREDFDLIVLDVFAGADSPEHLRERSFYEEASALLAADGVLAVNVGDDPGLRFVREQAEAMGAPGPHGEAPVLADLWALTEAGMLAGDRPGNVVLVGAAAPMPRGRLEALRAAGPHPAAVLDRMDLEQWLASLPR